MLNDLHNEDVQLYMFYFTGFFFYYIIYCIIWINHYNNLSSECHIYMQPLQSHNPIISADEMGALCQHTHTQSHFICWTLWAIQPTPAAIFFARLWWCLWALFRPLHWTHEWNEVMCIPINNTETPKASEPSSRWSLTSRSMRKITKYLKS